MIASDMTSGAHNMTYAVWHHTCYKILEPFHFEISRSPLSSVLKGALHYGFGEVPMMTQRKSSKTFLANPSNLQSLGPYSNCIHWRSISCYIQSMGAEHLSCTFSGIFRVWVHPLHHPLRYVLKNHWMLWNWFWRCWLCLAVPLRSSPCKCRTPCLVSAHER